MQTIDPMTIMKNNSVARGYIEELKPIRQELKGIVLLSEDEQDALSDEQWEQIEATIKRGEVIADTLDAIEYAIVGEQAARARVHYQEIGLDPAEAAQKSTLELLNATARHLAGRDVAVLIQEPRPGAIGETFYDGDALKIAISPRAVFDGDDYLRVFLHEVAHAKLHMTADCDKPTWKMEEDADQQANYWTAYARTHLDPTRYAGEGSGVTRQFRAKLITLLGSLEAAETIGTY
jgi:hypothetical protein